MNDPAVALAIARAIESAPDFAGLNVYAHFERVVDGKPHEAGEISFPCVLIDSKSQPLAGSASYATATVQVIVESQSDDDAAAIHNARQSALVEKFTDQDGLAIAFAQSGLKLLGRPAPSASDPDIEHRALRAVFTYKLGYAS